MLAQKKLYCNNKRTPKNFYNNTTLFLTGCETNDPMQCEQNVDMFLDKYCASATLSMSTADSIGTVTSTLSIVKSVTVTANAGDTSNLDKEAKRSPPAPVALGILLGLMVMILAAVTIGWIWTCQRAKKSKKAQSRYGKIKLCPNRSCEDRTHVTIHGHDYYVWA